MDSLLVRLWCQVGRLRKVNMAEAGSTEETAAAVRSHSPPIALCFPVGLWTHFVGECDAGGGYASQYGGSQTSVQRHELQVLRSSAV